VEKLSGWKWPAHVHEVPHFLQFPFTLPIAIEADFLFLGVDQDKGIGNFDSGEVIQVSFLLEIKVSVCWIESTELALPVPRKLAPQQNEAVGTAAIEFFQPIAVKFGRQSLGARSGVRRGCNLHNAG